MSPGNRVHDGDGRQERSRSQDKHHEQEETRGQRSRRDSSEARLKEQQRNQQEREREEEQKRKDAEREAAEKKKEEERREQELARIKEEERKKREREEMERKREEERKQQESAKRTEEERREREREEMERKREEERKQQESARRKEEERREEERKQQESARRREEERREREREEMERKREEERKRREREEQARRDEEERKRREREEAEKKRRRAELEWKTKTPLAKRLYVLLDVPCDYSEQPEVKFKDGEGQRFFNAASGSCLASVVVVNEETPMVMAVDIALPGEQGERKQVSLQSIRHLVGADSLRFGPCRNRKTLARLGRMHPTRSNRTLTSSTPLSISRHPDSNIHSESIFKKYPLSRLPEQSPWRPMTPSTDSHHLSHWNSNRTPTRSRQSPILIQPFLFLHRLRLPKTFRHQMLHQN